MRWFLLISLGIHLGLIFAFSNFFPKEENIKSEVRLTYKFEQREKPAERKLKKRETYWNYQKRLENFSLSSLNNKALTSYMEITAPSFKCIYRKANKISSINPKIAKDKARVLPYNPEVLSTPIKETEGEMVIKQAPLSSTFELPLSRDVLVKKEKRKKNNLLPAQYIESIRRTSLELPLNESLMLEREEYYCSNYADNLLLEEKPGCKLLNNVPLLPAASAPSFKKEKIIFSSLPLDIDFSREDTSTQEVLKGYLEMIKDLVEKNKLHFSPIHNEGSVEVIFKLNYKGEVMGIFISRDSSNQELNKATEKLIRNCAPFPSFPSELKQKSISLKMEVIYEYKKE